MNVAESSAEIGHEVRIPFGDEFRNKPFQSRAANLLDNETKAEQRSRVLGFLVSEHCGKQFRYLGFPGETWAFERLLADAVGLNRCRFRGMEASWAILERSVKWMPGSKPVYFQDDLGIGTFTGYRSTHATMVHAFADSWLSLSGTDICSPSLPHRDRKIAAKNFHDTYRNNNLIWLDFTSNLCRDTKRAMHWAFKHCDPKSDSVPIVITLNYGREAGGDGGMEQRERIMRSCFDGNKFRYYEPRNRWFYHSTNNGRMATWAGVLKRR